MTDPELPPTVGAIPARPPVAGGATAIRDFLIRDPVHGHVEPDETELEIIDLPIFQRLRRIKQLSNTYLVFPGAMHTRFEHSLGTMHMAARMAHRIEDLRSDPRAIRQIRLAALLHDLGHGPYSHTSETIMEGVTGKRIGNIRIAGDAIALLPELRDLLAGDYEGVADLLQRGQNLGVAYDILDGPIDGDKLDYLLRDSYYCGVAYGHPDSLRILHSLRKIRTPARGEDYLGISPKGVEAVQNLQFARYQMHRIVYYHKTRRIADAMLVRAALCALTEDDTLDANYYDFRPGDVAFLRAYFELDDQTLVKTVIKGGKASGKLMERVERRDLYKMALDIDPTSLGVLRYQDIQKFGRTELGALESKIAAEARIDPREVILDRANVANPAYRGPSDGLTEIRNVLVENYPIPKYLEEMPGIWTPDKKFVTHSIGVFCPEEARTRVAEVAPSIVAGP